jgi:hypothetical protein
MNIYAKIFPAGGPIRPVEGCMSAIAVCPRCGAQSSFVSRFCSRCGTALSASVEPGRIPAPSAVMPSPRAPENLAVIVVVLLIAIGVVLAGVFAAVSSVRTTTVPPGPGPRVIEVNVARSGDGTNWILAFISVPAGLTIYDTMLTILTSTGATALPATPLGFLNYSSEGAYYEQAQPGGPVVAGDRLLISTSTYPTGFGWRISDATTVFATGTFA